ncbi:hypothetical protein PISMIDRAFT_670540 [Pisolithus microcarpus 441]|uniref:Uncharacterized protein n=1 Tax=Pisolithus microcarpus 441 TaxID=765257 RepID=A0A0D0A7V7_9AGAM|nr:hypothetical protein PISMIDRAFT_670540 [Pisolithus microcarpus 441]
MRKSLIRHNSGRERDHDICGAPQHAVLTKDTSIESLSTVHAISGFIPILLENCHSA